MSHHFPNPEHLFLTRRDFVRRTGMGMGMLALGGLLGERGIFGPAGAVAAEQISSTNPLAARKPWHFAPKAKRVIYLGSEKKETRTYASESADLLRRFFALYQVPYKDVLQFGLLHLESGLHEAGGQLTARAWRRFKCS